MRLQRREITTAARRRSSSGGIGAAIWLATGLAGAYLVKQQLSRSADSLAGQTVLITGGSRGLGYLLAHEFARAGCRVAICARGPDDLEWARQQLQHHGVPVLALPCDVADPNQVRELVEQVNRQLGPIDILVNNAGIIQVGPYQTMQYSDFVMAMDVMFWGMLHTTMAVVPQMAARRRGRIVNITSIGGRVSVPHLLPYSSAKFAAVGLSEGLAAELAREGIRVTTVTPGLMRTGSHLQAFFKGDPQKEFALFSLSASLPMMSMSAQKAARQIVAAVRRGDAEVTLTLPALILSRLHGLWPGGVSRLWGAINGLLLPADATVRDRGLRGQEVLEEMPPQRRKVLDLLLVQGQRAAERYQNLEPEQVWQHEHQVRVR
jgi:NAD(P)-dependent dehydrogenase (short-subunit alcohol dehydrogenase family)